MPRSDLHRRVGVLAVATACGDDSPTAGSVTTAPAAATTGSVTTAPAPMTAPTAEGVTTTPVTTTAVTAGTVTTTPGSAAAPPGGESDIALEGREFVSSEVEGHDLVEGSQIRLTFYPDYIEGSAGCNFLEFTWSLDGDRLVITEWLMTTMGCEPALMEQDDWLASFVTAGPTVALAGDTLTLTGDAAAITLVDDEVAEPDLELEGTPWVLESLINAPAVSTVPGTPPPTLNFTAGAVVIDTGCNTGGTTYETGDATLTIGPFRLTRRACTNPDASAKRPRCWPCSRARRRTRSRPTC